MPDAPAPVKDNSRAPAEKPGPCCICCECKHSCRMRNPEREVGKSCLFLQIASQSHFSGAFEAENNENGCISALGLK